MFIPDPGSGFFPIPDPGSQKTWGGKKKLFKSVFSPFCSFPLLLKQILTHNCCTFCIFFIFLTQEKIGFKLLEIMVGSAIRDPEKKGTGSRIQIRNTGFNSQRRHILELPVV
jgi:hypothetical protein